MSEENKNKENCAVFTEGQKVVSLCSWNECLNGHKWPLTATVARCAGCGSPVLATKMENCPICNEPSKSTTIRVDHIAAGGPIVKFCLDEPSPGEVIAMTMVREHYLQAEDAPLGHSPMSKHVEVSS